MEYGGFVQQTLLATTDGFTQMERKMVTIVCVDESQYLIYIDIFADMIHSSPPHSW